MGLKLRVIRQSSMLGVSYSYWFTYKGIMVASGSITLEQKETAEKNGIASMGKIIEQYDYRVGGEYSVKFSNNDTK